MRGAWAALCSMRASADICITVSLWLVPLTGHGAHPGTLLASPLLTALLSSSLSWNRLICPGLPGRSKERVPMWRKTSVATLLSFVSLAQSPEPWIGRGCE